MGVEEEPAGERAVEEAEAGYIRISLSECQLVIYMDFLGRWSWQGSEQSTGDFFLICANN